MSTITPDFSYKVSGTYLVASFDLHHKEVFKHLQDSVQKGMFPDFFHSVVEAMFSCYELEKLGQENIRPQTLYEGTLVNPLALTGDTEFPSWLKYEASQRHFVIEIPCHEKTTELIGQLACCIGRRTVMETVGHLLRFATLIHKQKCAQQGIYYYRELTAREVRQKEKELKQEIKGKFCRPCNLFTTHEFHFILSH